MAAIYDPNFTINGQPGAYIKIIGDEEKKTETTNGDAAISLPNYSGADTALTAATEKAKSIFDKIEKAFKLETLLLLLGGALILRIILK